MGFTNTIIPIWDAHFLLPFLLQAWSQLHCFSFRFSSVLSFSNIRRMVAHVGQFHGQLFSAVASQHITSPVESFRSLRKRKKSISRSCEKDIKKDLILCVTVYTSSLMTYHLSKLIEFRCCRMGMKIRTDRAGVVRHRRGPTTRERR